MSILGTSRGYELAEDTAGKLTVSTQTDGIAAAVTNTIAGIFNGGMSGGVGMGHTLVAVGLPLATAAVQKKVSEGAWGIPFVGS